MATLERWLRARRRSALVAIMASSVILRVVCLLELTFSPAVALHTWNQTDMNYFVDWARMIADGDLLSRNVRPPLHDWHSEVAMQFADQHPEEWAALSASGAGGDDAAARRLWDRWCGGGQFYQDPLYPYLLAATVRLLGDSVLWVFAGQMLLGIVRNVLIYLLTRRMFGDLAAVVAAGLAVLYGPLLFHEAVLVRSTLIGVTGLVLVVLLDRAQRLRRSGAWATFGVALGVAMAVKGHFLVLAVGALVMLVARHRRRYGPAVRFASAMALGLLAGFSPVVVRNLVIGVPPTVTASGGPATFVAANSPGSSAYAWDLQNVSRIVTESDNAFLATAAATIRTHESLGAYLLLVLDKLCMTWCSYEAPNNANFYYFTGHSGVLRALPVDFGWIAPPALLGLLLAVRRRRRCGSLYWLVAANLGVILVVSVYARFRLPLVVALLPFAGLTVARLLSWGILRRWATLSAAVAVLAALGLWSYAPRPDALPRVWPTDVLVAYDHYYGPMVQQALASAQPALAADLMFEFLRAQPSDVGILGPDHPPESNAQAELAELYAQKYADAAKIVELASRSEEARAANRRSDELFQAIGTKD